MKNVDIIVPVYNAYEYTFECIKSILENTNLKDNSLVLINDKSPDKDILPMLMKYKSDNKDLNITVLDNEENLGFVKTVNKGMKYSTNDVILLNSDTEVTENWVEKIKKCAYSNRYIATVTPLTNNGTICSVPNFGVDNELPKGISLKEYAKMIEEVSQKRYPEITTANGFCMYIKRDILQEVGLFDEITFGKGYGEENDFCYRALDHGYINVMCDDTFIYHKGTQSFKKENLTESRANLIESHMLLLRKKHPIYVQKTDNFLALNPLKDIQENIEINIKLYHHKKILYLVNEWEEDMNMTGGTSLHIKDLIASNLNNNIASLVLAPDKADLSKFNLYLYSNDYMRIIANFKTDINLYGQIHYSNQTYKNILNTIFDSFKIDILHVHHFLFQTFDAIEIAKKREIYSIITLHDLYMMCPSINMVYKDIFCEKDKSKDCTNCLKIRYGVNENILSNWQEKCLEVLKKFDKVLVPSENTKKMFGSIYSDLDIEIVEHGVKVEKVELRDNENSKSKNTFDIAFVGAMAIHKGSNILNELIIKNNRNLNSDIRIHLFGKSEDKRLIKSDQHYYNHGKYTRGELPQLLIDNEIDLVCIFTTWPETYSYTLTEVYMAQVPVLAFDLGAVGDRLKKDQLGWTINIEDMDKIYNKIENIRDNKEDYQIVKSNFKQHRFKTTEEMQEFYCELYGAINLDKSTYSNIFRIKELQNKTIEIDFEQYRSNYSHVVHRYERMRNTRIWEIAKKIKKKLRGCK